MIRVNRTALRSLWLLGLWACAIAALGWSGRADAQCPGGDPCETIYVYRLQSRMPPSLPPIVADAAGRPLVSLQEANAGDATAFQGLLKATTSTKLAIRFQVTRIKIAPNEYCNCNLEYGNKGCHDATPLVTLRQCVRVCRHGNADCKVAGVDQKADTGGRWYAFPANTQCGVGGRNVWQKQTFRPNAAACDWLEVARVIKGAGCLARELPQHSLDSLFGPGSVCPDEQL